MAGSERLHRGPWLAHYYLGARRPGIAQPPLNLPVLAVHSLRSRGRPLRFLPLLFLSHPTASGRPSPTRVTHFSAPDYRPSPGYWSCPARGLLHLALPRTWLYVAGICDSSSPASFSVCPLQEGSAWAWSAGCPIPDRIQNFSSQTCPALVARHLEDHDCGGELGSQRGEPRGLSL